MSQLKPTILTNPQYATNNVDTQQAGWYQVSPNTSNLALRVSHSDIGLSGEIRLNTTSGIFQGSNGSAWIDFSATQGLQGNPGQDFTNAVNFNNLGSNTASSTSVPLASVFATTYANVAASLSNVNIRSLQGGQYIVNSNLTINSMSLSQNSNVITLSPEPLPYISFNQFPNNTLSYLKNSPNDSQFFSWGEYSYWTVKQGSTIIKGQAVRITNNISSTNLVIAPITYTTLIGASPFSTPFTILGIATMSASSGGICGVCTKGMTTALCTSNISAGFSPVNDIPFVGAYGLIGADGGLFCVNSSPTVDYMKAGYFLESGSSLAVNGNYVLFYVDPNSSSSF